MKVVIYGVPNDVVSSIAESFNMEVVQSVKRLNNFDNLILSVPELRTEQELEDFSQRLISRSNQIDAVISANCDTEQLIRYSTDFCKYYVVGEDDMENEISLIFNSLPTHDKLY